MNASTNTEDAVTKMIRLVANILTEDVMKADLKQLRSATLKFFDVSLSLLKKK